MLLGYEDIKIEDIIKMFSDFPFLNNLILLGSFSRNEAIAYYLNGRVNFISDLDLMFYTKIPVFWYKYTKYFNKYDQLFEIKLDLKIIHNFSKIIPSTEFIDIKRTSINLYGKDSSYIKLLKKIPNMPTKNEILNVFFRRRKNLAMVYDNIKRRNYLYAWYNLYKSILGLIDYLLFFENDLYFSSSLKKLEYFDEFSIFLDFLHNTEKYLQILPPRDLITKVQNKYFHISKQIKI